MNTESTDPLAFLVVRNGNGTVIDCCPWGRSSNNPDRFCQQDAFYNLAGMYDNRTFCDLQNRIEYITEAQGFELSETKVYPILDDDGAVWLTVQIMVD